MRSLKNNLCRGDSVNTLLAHWKLNEAAGNTRINAAGNPDFDPFYLFESAPTVASAAGKIGNAASFPVPATNYLRNDNIPAYIAGDMSFTFVGWYTPLAGRVQGGVFDINGGAFLLDDGAGELIMGVSNLGGSGSCTSSVTIVSGTFYFVICGYDAENNLIFIQVNNGAVDTTSFSGGMYAFTGGDFSLGFEVSGGGLFSGLIDSVSLFTEVLPQTKRTLLYNAGAGQDYPFPF